MIAGGLDVGRATVERVRKEFVEEGLEAALERRQPRRQCRGRLDGDGEAHLVALACQKPPEGRCRWTLRRSNWAFCVVSACRDESTTLRTYASKQKPGRTTATKPSPK